MGYIHRDYASTEWPCAGNKIWCFETSYETIEEINGLKYAILCSSHVARRFYISGKIQCTGAQICPMNWISPQQDLGHFGHWKAAFRAQYDFEFD